MCSASTGAGRVGRGIAVSVLFLLGSLGFVVLWLVLLTIRAHRRDAGRAPVED
jgi:hypothetical protein